MIATPPIVAETVLVSGVVELSVPVATPLALVGPAGCVSVLPDPDALSVTVAPLTGLPFASRAVTVMVDVPLPDAIEVGEAVTVDCDADTGPAVTVMPAVCVRVTPPAVAVTVLLPAAVELSVPVATPLALVGPAGCVSVLPDPVALNVTVTPLKAATLDAPLLIEASMKGAKRLIITHNGRDLATTAGETGTLRINPADLDHRRERHVHDHRDGTGRERQPGERGDGGAVGERLR